MDHLLSWDWDIFIFYPYPLSNLLIFWISQLQTAPNTTQSRLTPPSSASWEQKSKSLSIHPAVWPKLATLSKGYCSWAGWNKEQEKGKVRPRVSRRDSRDMAGSGACRLPTPVSDRTLPHQNVSLPFQAALGLVLKHHLSATSQSRNIDQPMLSLRRGWSSDIAAVLLTICVSSTNCAWSQRLPRAAQLEHVSGWTCSDLVFQLMPWISCMLQRHLFIPVKTPRTGWSQTLGLLP